MIALIVIACIDGQSCNELAFTTSYRTTMECQTVAQQVLVRIMLDHPNYHFQSYRCIDVVPGKDT